MSIPSYSVSILSYRRPDMTQRCLESVLRFSPRDVEILATDNGSKDRTAQVLAHFAKRDPRVKVITHRENLGVGAAKNMALDRAKAEWFVSLDNDCVVGRNWLEMLRSGFTSDDVGQVGRKGAFQTLGENGIGFKGDRLDYIDGSCFMVRAALARSLGLCDPAFGMAYCEDSDFSLRLKAAGYRIATVQVHLVHRLHQTAHHTNLDLRDIAERNRKRFLERWGDWLAGGPLVPCLTESEEQEVA